ncbi:hypothetical protein CMV30_01380 [Nibricoccus aquaticus]|uniref:Uncharacterized protein n=1 Tax=Nibricoccus aquaticus TaxID=2576891 RepID=A0A290Q2J0_9BACT|nr:hypothetical protein [Nibricoccus aquaticus]ATC62724.1 hypothetical protein CMV30_01380 [Nibricoccus aquaticus]
MTREQLFLQLLSDDLHTLHASALALEKDLNRLSREIESHNIDSLSGLVARINCVGFTPIEAMLREAGIPESRDGSEPQAVLNGVLAEAGEKIRRAETSRLGVAGAISIMRRAARYMEMYCSSVADSALRLRLDGLSDHLRAWAREWIGLELNLNAFAARPRIQEQVFAAA